MDDWNGLESRLAGWTPRGPSARLEARLFSRTTSWTGRRRSAGVRPRSTSAASNWLAPATAFSLLLALFVVERCFRATDAAVGVANPRLMAAALSNQSYSAYVGAANIAFNAPVLGVPKQSELTSTLRSFPPPATNHLLY